MPAVPVPIGLPPAQVGSAAEVLALAFQNDPISRYVLPDETHRCRVLRWMFQRHLRYGQRYGVVSTTAAVDGVAIWLPPGQTTQTLWRLLRTGALLAPLQFGWEAFQHSMAFRLPGRIGEILGANVFPWVRGVMSPLSPHVWSRHRPSAARFPKVTYR